MRSLRDHLTGPGPKRILALDGGGVRGLITIAYLQRIEDLLAARLPKQDRAEFRLCHYFDLIGGTSTGGIIACLLALGWSAAEVREAYLKICPRVFKKHRGAFDRFVNPYNVFAPGFDAKEFKRAVDDIVSGHLRKVGRIGMVEPTLGSDLLLTGLGLISKRIDTGSVWALTNNPRARYWDPDSRHWQHTFASPHDRFHPNRDFPISILAQGTASAPFLLKAVELSISPMELGVFLDGGASPFNCPALELFQMATLKQYDDSGKVAKFSPYGFDWEVGEDKILLCSLGTGSWRTRMSAADYTVRQNWEQAKIALMGMIDDGMKTSVTWLQAMSEPRKPWRIDGNLEHMHGLRIMREKLLTFQRVNLELDHRPLQELGFKLTDAVLERTRALDNADAANLKRLDEIGKAAAESAIDAGDFPAKFDPRYATGDAETARTGEATPVTAARVEPRAAMPAQPL